MRRALGVVALVAALLAGPALAVLPDEILADPMLESRARGISRLLRCPVCQGENIDESNAPVARDLRLLVRERLVEGDSDAAVIDYVVARYGEFVLFQPRAQGVNLALWLAGPGMLMVALGIGLVFVRGRARAEAAGQTALNPEERARLEVLLRDEV